jgi:hypothetical protein
MIAVSVRTWKFRISASKSKLFCDRLPLTMTVEIPRATTMDAAAATMTSIKVKPARPIGRELTLI